jgi:hypothetical protein
MNQIKRKFLTQDGKERWVLSPFRSLTNYKALHKKRAQEKKVEAEFMSAQTLTQARRILFG